MHTLESKLERRYKALWRALSAGRIQILTENEECKEGLACSDVSQALCLPATAICHNQLGLCVAFNMK